LTGYRRVLIADPDSAQLDKYRAYFHRGGWSLDTALSGLECLAKLRDAEPDVLVMEPDMPWGGGSGVLECMHQDPSVANTPVIVLTTGRDRDELLRVLDFKLEDFLIKPVSAEELAKRIRQVTKGRAKARL
jgi:DNA-binding response OmpR family regulator